MTAVMEEVLLKCRNPLCLRKVKASVAYCCDPCWYAHEHKFEIHESGPLGHTDFCQERFAERGECTREEALLLDQDRHHGGL